ncbi:SDR family NAD(P)-dependent oxidoreductase [Candidatus Nitrososphaera sp. FF02]|uniref:SDR family NAD(P)-dependent oxidoreductase n=1 Tax=Candidatus Nitrososphaera sp. FF02 TaxID=3398226 RepID=UPI0039E73847
MARPRRASSCSQRASPWSTASTGIRCNCIAPSTIRSSMIEPYLQDENAKKVLESTFPLRRIGEPEDVAGAVAYLSSDDAKWVTGTVLVVDGGVTAKQ